MEFHQSIEYGTPSLRRTKPSRHPARKFPDSGRGQGALGPKASLRSGFLRAEHPPLQRRWSTAPFTVRHRYAISGWRPLTIIALLAALCACGGGGSSSPDPVPQPAAPPPAPEPPASGCSVDVASGPFETAWPGLEWESATPESQGLCPDALESAIDYAFAAGEDTGAVIIVRNGRIVAERYADDRGANDQATSWSVAKSFTSALVGAALDDGLIGSLDQSMADFIPAWRDTDKAAITLRHTMTVRTALEILDGGEFYNGADQLQTSIDRALTGTPGEQTYDYSNSDVMLAGEVVRVATGMSAEAFLDSRIGATIGFSGDWWTDSAGHVMTYCCLDATPRNFARFGLLFARRGQWNGQTVLSNDWFTTSTGPAYEGEYGFYWWPGGGVGFVAIGLHGQIIGVYPDADLVATRFSRYTRVGDGRPVREQGNYHGTNEPTDFEVASFLDQVFEAIEG